MQFVKNEHSPDLLGVVATNPFFNYDSFSRIQMYCTHIGQSLVMKDPSVKRTLTGVEREYGRFTHAIRMPCDAVILKCIHKYPRTLGSGNIDNNPLISVIYEDISSPTHEVGVLDLTHHHCVHQYFGFKYRYTNALSRLVPGAMITKGTVIADSPSITEDGDYMYGIEAQMALMSVPGTIEDGIIVSESFRKRMTTTAFGSRIESWGKNRYPLNLYGDEQNYKPFPDIGQRIRDDGLLFATRPYDEFLSVVQMTPETLRQAEPFDRTTYAVPNAKVVDVIVHRGRQNKQILPVGMAVQSDFYYQKSLAYHEAILAEYQTLRRKIHNLHVSPAFHRLIVESMAMVQNTPSSRVVHIHNRNPIDEWMVEVVFEYDCVPTVGYKATDANGGKGVICAIWPDEDMPVDAIGNRADMIMDDLSTIKRMNIGRLYEQYINAAGLRVSKTIAKELEITPQPNEERLQELWDFLMGFYKIVSPRHHEAVIASGGETRRLKHLTDVARRGVYLFMPTDTPVSYKDVVTELVKHYPAAYGPVTYRGKSGRRVTTKNPVLIGGLYMLLLEKTGNTWAGVSSAKLQHLGIPAKLTNSDKYSLPYRPQPVKILGESEVRLMCAAIDGFTVADLLDQSNNPAAHRAIVKNILHADKPAAIPVAVDRSGNPPAGVEFVPMGKGRVLTYLNHVLECGGMRFVRRRG